MSYFCLYIYKAIRKVLFLPILTKKVLLRSYFWVLNETSIIENHLLNKSHKTTPPEWFEVQNVITNCFFH